MGASPRARKPIAGAAYSWTYDWLDNRLSQTVNGAGTSFLYDGQNLVSEISSSGTGPYSYRARYYAPAWGRFMSPDPAGLAAGVNLYAYVGNNPVNFRDPSGLSPIYDDDGSPAFDNLYTSRMSVVEPDGVRLAMNTFEGTFGALMPGYDLITGAAGYNVFGCRLGTGERVTRTITGAISVVPALGALDDVGSLGSIGRKSVSAAESMAVADNSIRFIHSSGDWTRVGRWMSEAELDSMIKTGRIQPNLQGMDLKHVAFPNPDAFQNAGPGSVFAEFNVPQSQLRAGDDKAWRIVFSPNSIFGRLAALLGNPLAGMPEALDIVVTARK